MLSDDIKAFKDLWILGDSFIREMFHTLRAMKFRPGQIRNDSNANLEPYIHRKYNVRAYYNKNQFSQENALARLYNALVKGINDNAKLPRIILVIPGVEFFNSINHKDYGVSLMIGKCIDWYLTNFQREIRTRKMDIYQKRIGAVEHLEPKVIWVKMLIEGNRSSTLIDKFNAILEQGLFNSGSGFIMETLRFHPALWDRNQKLNHDGRIQFWQHISRIIKGFDKQQTRFDLLPKSVINHQHTNNA